MVACFLAVPWAGMEHYSRSSQWRSPGHQGGQEATERQKVTVTLESPEWVDS